MNDREGEARPRALRVAVVGLGYFSQFHLQAWAANGDVELVGVCDRQTEVAKRVGEANGVSYALALDGLPAASNLDIVDIIAPPVAHLALVRQALAPGRLVICQKPFCESIADAETLLAEADAVGACIVIHENFRFQPWHREVRDVLQSGALGQVYQARFALRPGDGQGPEAYLARQPAFQRMPKLLIHETGVHFVDLFRWWFGEIDSVYADLRRLNPVIAGEDAGVVIMHHASGVQSVFDGNRLADHVAADRRRTMGELVIEGADGELRLDGDGQLHRRAHGALDWVAVPVTRPVDDTQFGGGCVAELINHAVAAHRRGQPPENALAAYLPVMRVTEAAYTSAAEGRRVTLTG
ncbi:MAG: Gfo/Idh/MocA family oxidoreductase [Pseudomonadota bacterium]